MAKAIAIYAMVVMAVFYALPAYAAADGLVESMGAKLSRGAVDIFTGWMEIPAQMKKDRAGVVKGFYKGFYHALGRTASGIKEVFTFWAANPRDNEEIGIPLDGTRAWRGNDHYDMFSPDFTSGTLKPMQAKLTRGAANGFLGIMEVPGQIIKGSTSGAPDIGIVKGVWYCVSRMACGVGDIITFMLPNHTYEEGLPFDEEWPWDAFTEASDFR
jgi:putative exosortase-associated protein (TIGR04073 family)